MILFSLYMKTIFPNIIIPQGERIELSLWLGKGKNYLITSKNAKCDWTLYQVENENTLNRIYIGNTSTELEKSIL